MYFLGQISARYMMRLLSIAVAFFFFSSTGFSQEFLFVVFNKSVSKDLVSSDNEQSMHQLNEIKKLIERVSPQVKVENLLVDDIQKDLGLEVSQHLSKSGPNGKIKGFIFLGHGNREYFVLSKDKRYDSVQLAKEVAGAVRNYPVSDEFAIHIGSCLSACPVENGRSFEERFAATLKDALAGASIAPKIINVTAQIYGSGVGFLSSNRGFISWLLYKTDLAGLSEKYLLKLHQRHDYVRIAIAAVGLTGVAALIAPSALNVENVSSAYYSSVSAIQLGLVSLFFMSSRVGSRMIQKITLKKEGQEYFQTGPENGILREVLISELEGSCVALDILANP